MGQIIFDFLWTIFNVGLLGVFTVLLIKLIRYWQSVRETKE